MAKDIDTSKRVNENIENERINPQRIIMTNNKLNSSGIEMYINAHNKRLIVRKISAMMKLRRLKKAFRRLHGVEC